MLCQDCTKRSTCKELCPDAERYVGQDEVTSTREVINSDGDVSEIYTSRPSEEWPLSTKSRSELILLMYFTDRLTQAQVAEKIGVSRQYVSKIIRKYSNMLKGNIQKTVASKHI